MSTRSHVAPTNSEKIRLSVPVPGLSAKTAPGSEPFLRDLSALWQGFLAGDLGLVGLRNEINRLFLRHDIQVNRRELEKFTQALGAATVDWHRARNAARVAVNLPPVTYSHYTPGPSGLNPGDPRTYSMAPNPGWKTMLTGAAVLVSAPVWVPVVTELGHILIGACLSNPVNCNNWGYEVVQGLIKGSTDQKTGQPTLNIFDYFIGRISEKAGELIISAIENKD